MMTTFYRIISMNLVLMLFAFFSTNAQQPVIGGSFVTGDLCYSWSDARWQEEFSAMKDAGMQYVVIQAVANSYPDEVTKTIYPSNISNTEMATSYPDVVDACLRNAEEAGLKVFIGIDLNDYWWSSYANDSTWLYSQMELDNQICDELWDNYKGKYSDTFVGWYWCYEIENLNFTLDKQQEVLINAINKQLDHLEAENERMPMMWCPFMNSQVGTASAYKTTWEKIFAGLHLKEGDIFCPQDCVGAGGLDIDEVDTWFAALKEAVDAQPGLVMWSDVETFKTYNSSFISATIDRVVRQLEIEQPYVDNYITWEYTYYDSPFHTSPGFYKTYMDYLSTGVVETSSPTVPNNFTATLQDGGDIALNWDASEDNIGICGYNVYRNEQMLYKCQVLIGSNDTTINSASTNYIDITVDPSTEYSYKIEAYDFAGNVSAQTSSITVTTASYNTVSAGCSYTMSISASSTYPDPNGKKLTNGNYASTAYYADAQWVGVANADADTEKVIIDLGSVVSVQQFLGDYLLDPQPAVYLPKEVRVSISTDNVNFTELGTLTDNSTNDTSSSIHKYYYNAPEPVDARYVMFSTVAGGYWLFIDEYEVRNSIATDAKESVQIVPEKFDLSNNYPNPFNPATTIKVSLNEADMMSLEIHNSLGQLVKVVDEGYKSAGVYFYNINMNNFASGTYFCTLHLGNNSMTKKMLLMK